MQLLTDIRAQGQYLFRAALVTVLIVAVYLFHPEGESKAGERLRRLIRRPLIVVFVYYGAFLLTSTVLGRSFVRPNLNVTSRFGLLYRGQLNYDLVENIIFFVPFTLLYLSAFRVEKPFAAAVALSFICSLLLEMCQLIGRLGEFQLADILYNTMGGAAGWLLWRGLRRIKRAIRTKNVQKYVADK